MHKPAAAILQDNRIIGNKEARASAFRIVNWFGSEGQFKSLLLFHILLKGLPDQTKNTDEIGENNFVCG